MPDLDAALASRHPSVLPKHWIMLAASGVVWEDGKLLLVRDLHGFWAGIGGWVEPGETPEQAIIREAREELGVEAEVVSHFRPFIAWNVREQEPPVSFLLFPHRIKLASLDLRPDPQEVTAVAWVAPDELDGYDMMPQIRGIYRERLGEWLAE